MSDQTWVRCNSCKKSIDYRATYWVCNVSTCNSKRLGLKFCTVACWDAHQPMMNHRESWAEERQAPSAEEWARTLAGEDKTPRTRKPKAEPAPIPEAVSSAPKVIVRRSSS